MSKREELEARFAAHGCTAFKWVEPKDIVVSQWVRVKCTFGCPGYGRNATCPPNVPSVAECRQFFDEYHTAALFHFAKAVDKPEDRKEWGKTVNATLLKLEREVFLAGHQQAFLLFMDTCHNCPECPGLRSRCKDPASARPTPEAFAVDVFSTARKQGFPIEVLADYTQPMNRYAILLVE
jgi:predicted metal-binding protein